MKARQNSYASHFFISFIRCRHAAAAARLPMPPQLLSDAAAECRSHDALSYASFRRCAAAALIRRPPLQMIAPPPPDAAACAAATAPPLRQLLQYAARRRIFEPAAPPPPVASAVRFFSRLMPPQTAFFAGSQPSPATARPDLRRHGKIISTLNRYRLMTLNSHYNTEPAT